MLFCQIGFLISFKDVIRLRELLSSLSAYFSIELIISGIWSLIRSALPTNSLGISAIKTNLILKLPLLLPVALFCFFLLDSPWSYDSFKEAVKECILTLFSAWLTSRIYKNFLFFSGYRIDIKIYSFGCLKL